MRINFADGQTAAYALDETPGAQAWAQIQADAGRQNEIRGAMLEGDVKRVAVQAPRQFQRVAYAASLETNEHGQIVGERVEVQADDVRLTVTLLQSGMVRVLLARPGKARHLAQFSRRIP